MGKESVELRFLFANHDGTSKVLEFPLDTTSETVKQRVMDNWPDNLERCQDPRRFRLLCMGKELQSTKTLKALNIPVYDHPTPVNVSVLPKSLATPNTKQPNAKAMPAQACCIVM